MAKKKSRFELDKGSGHNFDISKGKRRKFDLTKDSDTVSDSPEITNPVEDGFPPVGSASETPPQPPRKNGNWLWVIVGLVVIGLLIWWLIPKSSTSDRIPETVDTVEEVNETADESVTPGITTEDSNIEPEVAAEPSATPSDGQTPEYPAAVTTGSSTPTTPEKSDVNPVVASDDIEAEAMSVIRGNYGNGYERRNRLGSKYQAIQRRVNELKRGGVF